MFLLSGLTEPRISRPIEQSWLLTGSDNPGFSLCRYQRVYIEEAESYITNIFTTMNKALNIIREETHCDWRLSQLELYPQVRSAPNVTMVIYHSKKWTSCIEEWEPRV